MSADRIAELGKQVARLERAKAFSAAVDERLELALKKRQPLERVMPALLELLCERAGAKAAAVRTLDESLSERTFVRGDVDITVDVLESGETQLDTDEGVVLIEHLDVAGEPFGTAFLFMESAPDDDEVADILRLFCEELDNHLAAIAQARRKFEIIRAISDALKEPVLVGGIGYAVDILRREVDFSDLVLMFRHEDSLESSALRYRIHKDGELVAGGDTFDPEIDAFMRKHASAFFDGDDSAIRERFGITRYREEVLITGVRTARVIGRMLVTSRQGEFHTYDRELLDRFADYLRQRIVDFNREWKQLSKIFDGSVCERLLREEGYLERWLTPRDREVAILFCDIAGFTRISEQVLKSPQAVGRLIDTWADRVVSAIWQNDGVFDKMIGDCVIGIFGPPFYEDDAKKRCAKALDTAVAIRDLTRALTSDPDLKPELGSLTEPLQVSTGLNYCPVSVGFFGPNEDYTAFSSGMNNTARLQGIADAGEILCMQRFVDEHGDADRFGESDSTEVKNVAEPLVYRSLKR